MLFWLKKCAFLVGITFEFEFKVRNGDCLKYMCGSAKFCEKTHLKKGWDRALIAEIRYLGTHFRHSYIRSAACAISSWVYRERELLFMSSTRSTAPKARFYFSKYITGASHIISNSSISWEVGFPLTWACSKTWRPSASPGKSGVLVINSNRIQPVDHMSMLQSYSLLPNISSGAR